MADRDDFRRRVDDAVLVLFTLVAESLTGATAALLDEDTERAAQVIADDRGIDERCEALNGLVKDRLADSRRPADELEELVVVLQIVPELERSADLAEHIAQRALRGLGGTITPRARAIIQSMCAIAVQMWQVAGAGYQHRSRDASIELAEADNELDGLAASLVADGVTGEADSQVAVDLALIARFYERLGDHAVNIARRVELLASPHRLARPALTPRRAAAAASEFKQGWPGRALARIRRLRLAPVDEAFFDLFQQAGVNARDCAEVLAKLSVSLDDPDDYVDRIRALERRGDQITIELLRRLDASFVTPFDREDIHELTEELDDVVDDMFAAASLIQLVRVERPLPELAELADVLVAMAVELGALMSALRSREGARHRLERIEHFERQGDAIFRRGMGRLFSGEYTPLDVIKWKDILQAVEESLNAIEDVSDVVESILVKNG